METEKREIKRIKIYIRKEMTEETTKYLMTERYLKYYMHTTDHRGSRQKTFPPSLFVYFNLFFHLSVFYFIVID